MRNNLDPPLLADSGQRFRDRLVVLPRGAVVAAGPPVEALNPALIERVWNARADVDVVDGVAPIRFPLRSRAEEAED